MLQNLKRPATRGRFALRMDTRAARAGVVARRAGFTLTEMLVAIAIFITVISGVFALYAGAVSTVRKGNQDLTMNADGRVALKVLEEDLKLAFTAREFGDPNQFYGRPEGFMFVGKLSTGTEGRVTYVINPNAAPDAFDTQLSEPWSDLQARIWTQVHDAAYNLFWATVQGVGGASSVAEDLATAEANKAKDRFRIDFPPPASGDDTPMDFSVIASSYALLRYEESDRKDLDNFDLPLFSDGTSMTWPSIDSYSSANDQSPSLADNTPEGALYYFLKSALGDRSHEIDAPNRINNDLRDLAASAFTASGATSYVPASSGQVTAQLNAIGPEFVQKAVADKRREFWIRLLADDPSIVQADPGVNPGANGFAPRFWTNDNTDQIRKHVKDYVLTERILNRATLYFNGQPYTYLIQDPTSRALTPVIIDALKVPGVFAYGFDKSEFSEGNVAASSMNTLSRINNYSYFYNDPSPVSLSALDQSMAIMFSGGGNSPLYAGTPLVPRLPALVQVRFWLADEKVLPNTTDFRRLFVQLLEVPAGMGSSVNQAVQQQQAAQSG